MVQYSMVWYWARKANNGPIKIFDQWQSGCPKLRQSTELMDQIDQQIWENWRLMQQQLAVQAGIGLGMVNRKVADQ